MRKIAWISTASFLSGIFLTALIFVYLPERSSKNLPQENPSSQPFSSPLYANSSLPQKPDLDFVSITEKVSPAVVKISADKVYKRRTLEFEDWPFEDFWDRFFGRPREREREYRSTAEGTGFFISTDGYILTNNHLVENAEKVTIFTGQGNEYEAKIIGTDPKTDIALLKVEAKDIPAAELGDSSQVKPGEWVLAIGNPWGLEHTVTAGIVSAKGRQLGTGANLPDYQDFIQTDAAINQGNSGGPLVNMKGEVIGITSNILTPSGGNIGIGFAIPSNLAKKVVKQLREKGRVVRSRLGVGIRDIIQGELKLLNLKNNKGALVVSVEEGSPAERAGLKRYDVIVEVNGQPVQNGNDLRLKISDMEPGTKITLKIIREGKEKELEATVEELEPEQGERPGQVSSGKDIGISVRALTPSLARRYGFRTTEGLLITDVRPYSEADRRGLQRGDIILEINRKRVRTVEDLESVLKRSESGDSIMLLIRREIDGEIQETIVTLRIP